MPVPFSRRQHREEQERMTPRRILGLACREQGFTVSWRYRDDWLRDRCGKLRKKGLLRREGGRGAYTYRITAAGRAVLEEGGDDER